MFCLPLPPTTFPQVETKLQCVALCANLTLASSGISSGHSCPRSLSQFPGGSILSHTSAPTRVHVQTPAGHVLDTEGAAETWADSQAREERSSRRRDSASAGGSFSAYSCSPVIYPKLLPKFVCSLASSFQFGSSRPAQSPTIIFPYVSLGLYLFENTQPSVVWSCQVWVPSEVCLVTHSCVETSYTLAFKL